MIYLGIVGAESTLGKSVLKQISNNTDKYCVAFTVDVSYESSIKDNKFDDPESALLLSTPTLILDFGPAIGAMERAKSYLWYHVPAIMQTAGLEGEALELLHSVRAARGSSPMLVVERCLSSSLVLLVEQMLQNLRICAANVQQVALDFSYSRDGKFDITPYMPLIERINRCLGYTDWQPKHDAYQDDIRYNQQFGFVQITLQRTADTESVFMDGLYDLQASIRTKTSWFSYG